MQRPYKAPGIGWILAALVLIVVVLALLHVIVISETILLFLLGALALAILV